MRPPKPEFDHLLQLYFLERIGKESDDRTQEVLRDRTVHAILEKAISETWHVLPLSLDGPGWIEGLERLWLPALRDKAVAGLDGVIDGLPPDSPRLENYKAFRDDLSEAMREGGALWVGKDAAGVE